MKTYLIRLALALVATIGAGIALVWLWGAALAASPRAWKIILACDELFNAAGGGDPQETVSSRAGKSARHGRPWGCLLCRLLSALDPGHCEKSIETNAGDPAG